MDTPSDGTQIKPQSQPLVAVITCAVLETEVEHFVRSCPHVRHVEKIRQGLHNDPPQLRRELQEAVERCLDRDRAIFFTICLRI